METGEVLIELLYKKIENKLSAEEECRVNQWLETPAHLAYFEYLENFCNLSERTEVTEEELQMSWETLREKITDHSRGIVHRRILRVGVVAASVVLIFGFFHFFSNRTAEEITDDRMVRIGPGQHRAILEFADGRVYDLTDFSRQRDRKITAHIRADSCCLNYVRPDSASAQTFTYHKLTVPRGGEFRIVLEDGTKVWLNSESCLKYPESFAGAVREVFLEGEAYFEVTRSSDRPFVVRSGMQKVTVSGTSFGIIHYPDDPGSSATLVEGKVVVEYPEITGQQYPLEPGDRIFRDFKGNTIRKEKVDIREYVAWKDGKYVFTRKRLEDMLTTLSRWYDFEVFYQNPEAKEVLFSGELMRFENFNDILNMIEKSGDVKFTVDRHVVVVAK